MSWFCRGIFSDAFWRWRHARGIAGRQPACCWCCCYGNVSPSLNQAVYLIYVSVSLTATSSVPPSIWGAFRSLRGQACDYFIANLSPSNRILKIDLHRVQIKSVWFCRLTLATMKIFDDFGKEITRTKLNLIFKENNRYTYFCERNNLGRTIILTYPQQKATLSFLYIKTTPSEGKVLRLWWINLYLFGLHKFREQVYPFSIVTEIACIIFWTQKGEGKKPL